MALTLRYRTPAEDSARGWEEESLPIGCGYFGANVFGIPSRERIQITENSLQNPGRLGGLNNLAELYLEFPHTETSGYERGLKLDDATAYCRYTADGVTYTRECFASYPDRCLVVALRASAPGKLSFTVAPEIPFIKDYAAEAGDGAGKSGQVVSKDGDILLEGLMHHYRIQFAARIHVETDGVQTCENGRISVDRAQTAWITLVCATNYRLSPHVFLEPDDAKKLQPADVAGEAARRLRAAVSRGYDGLRARHLRDYQNLFGRVSFCLEGCDETAFTADMLADYREGRRNPYLEMLYFQYGRYLLIASSRPGTLPANLQGTWNCHDHSPWGSGYWHNINVQMNYWPAFSANLAETFEPYRDFNEAFRPAAAEYAAQYIRTWNPENADAADGPEAYGWTIGTASYPYTISMPGGHSGPGTGGLTTKLFADWYDFTQDPEILKTSVLPALESMSRFLTRTVRDYDGEYLVSFSASPEQLVNGHYAKSNIYYQTVGCSFDQQMIAENGKDLLRLAREAGYDSEDVRRQKEQQDHYAPVLVGWSGQIKEFREENLYGEIGEYRHRHISQLVGLYPGTQITSETPAWMDAAKITLNERGDESTGWALAHRLNAWARTGDGDRAYRLLGNILSQRTYTNLWNFHPPFQIDSSFGGTAGVAEMLLQSHEGYLSVLPAVPAAWAAGSFSGLCARGGFEVSARWSRDRVEEIRILAKKGGICRVKCGDLLQACVEDENGSRIAYSRERDNLIGWECRPGAVYRITQIARPAAVPAPENLRMLDDGQTIAWTAKPGCRYRVYRAADNEAVYTLLADGVTDGCFRDCGQPDAFGHLTYKVTACDGPRESDGALLVRNKATKLYLERYRHIIRQLDSLK